MRMVVQHECHILGFVIEWNEVMAQDQTTFHPFRFNNYLLITLKQAGSAPDIEFIA